MPNVTLGYGALLVLLGLGGYLGSGMASITALIPAFFGAVFVVLGLIARAKPGARMHVMHVAVLLALFAIAGSLRGAVKLPALLAGTAQRPMAIIAQTVMLVLSAGYMALAIRSFVTARRARKQGAAA